MLPPGLAVPPVSIPPEVPPNSPLKKPPDDPPVEVPRVAKYHTTNIPAMIHPIAFMAFSHSV